MENIIIIIFSAVSLGVALASLCYSIFKGKRKVDETEMLRAPLLLVTSYALNKEYELVPPQDSGLPDSKQFSLDRRTYQQIDTEEKSSHYTIYMNATRSSGEEAKELLALGTIQIENAGYQMASCELEAINIAFLNGKSDLRLNPRQVDGEPVHNVLSLKDEPIEIFVSYRVSKNGDHSMLDLALLESQWEQKKQAAGENMLNVYMPGEVSCDRWKTITITFKTSNVHEELYRQEVILTNRDGVFTASSRLLERVKEK